MLNILDIFENPVNVTPQQEISKTLNSSKIPKYLTFTCGEITFTFGGMTLTFGEIRFSLGDSRRFYGFWNFCFVAGGGWGLCGSGGPVQVFEKR